ncbi:hypothetical protein AMQ84_27255 [Paenibacillus riograndensis]|uniref:Uncharacterized protein n=1 Tax=Paenibacillus riograndensis TaxID=483937 RepID=A0A132TJY6_9BACL|nr:hypothetical protein [Paenibacillus riograndensis]KWX71622.1 hypothetical protein AMQ84_27255 [Paenibacillus riograndensis]
MALKKTIELPSGLTLQNAYIRVQGVNGNKNIADICLELFVSQQACEEEKVPVTHMYFRFTPDQEEDATRWDKQAYEHLKTLPEFENAVDV